MDKMLYLPTEQGDFLWAVVGEPLAWLVLWLVIINLAAFLTFGLDKWKAKRNEKKGNVRRIPEKRLFLLAALGGSVGALLGMYTFRHKTKHLSFVLGLPAILIAQIALVILVILHY